MMTIFTIGIFLAVAMALSLYAASPNLRDASLKLTKALPGSATTVYATPGIDTGKVSSKDGQLAEVEFLLSAPALTTAQLGDAATMKYSILMDDVDPIDSGSTALHTDILTQTGAGGAGAAAATKRFKIPSDAKRIIGFKIVNSAAGDASGVSATLEVLA